MKLEFGGKTVLATGAAHGFGRAISVCFAARGASVWGCDLLEEVTRDEWRSMFALKRLGTPDDIAHAVLFFASSYAGWITGQVLSVDGGK